MQSVENDDVQPEAKKMKSIEFYTKRKEDKYDQLRMDITNLDLITIIEEILNVSKLKSAILEERLYDILLMCRVKEFQIMAAINCSSASAKIILSQGIIPEKLRIRLYDWIKILYITAITSIANQPTGEQFTEKESLNIRYAFANFPYANKSVLTILCNTYIISDIGTDKPIFIRKLFAKWRSLYEKQYL
jgi:hypothetical protein